MMVIAERLWLRTHDGAYLCVAKRWAKGTAILFAVGAVSGTVLSFELGLLWPRFMGFAGAAIGMPFSLEGFAFFTVSEAAAAPPVLWALIGATVAGLLVLFPSIWYLMQIFKASNEDIPLHQEGFPIDNCAAGST
jgi:bd-type cytochrome oxidase subunit I